MRLLPSTLIAVVLRIGLLSPSIQAAAVSGTVYRVDGSSRMPASGVPVLAYAAAGPVLATAETDARGRYEFKDLPSAVVRVSIVQKGYVVRPTIGGEGTGTVDLTGTVDALRQDFELVAGGVITGRITDLQAEPLERVEIELRNTSRGDQPPIIAATDDKGTYRVFGLAPGRYLLRASRGGKASVPIYFPGRSTVEQAQTIEVAAGTETAGIDLRLELESHAELDSETEGTRSAEPPSLAPTASVGAQQEKPGSISGQILSAQTGDLLKSASVTLSALDDGEVLTRTVDTSSTGSFLFEGLKPGVYSLSVRKTGFALKSLPHPIELKQGQSVSNTAIKLNRVPAISGRVRDLDGRPVVGASVAVYRINWQKGRRIVTLAGSSSSDDRGIYRLTVIFPGHYLVGASPPVFSDPIRKGELNLGSGRTYYPSAKRPSEAIGVDACYGQELSGIDIKLVEPATFSVSGVAADAEVNGPCTKCLIRATSLDESYGFSQAQVPVAPNGMYVVRGLVPGSYRIQVEKISAGRALLSSRKVEITNRDATEINLLAGVSHGVSGRIVFESEPPAASVADPAAGPQPAATKMAVVLTKPDGIGTFDTTRVESDGTFQFTALSGEEYLLQVLNLPQGGYLRAIRSAGRELASPVIDMGQKSPSEPAELLVSFRSAKIVGQVRVPEDSKGTSRPPVDAIVKLVPRERESPYLSLIRARVQADGSFTATGIPPGSYVAFAASRDSTLNFEDPDVQNQMQKYGRTVTVDSGKAAMVELPLIPDDQP